MSAPADEPAGLPAEAAGLMRQVVAAGLARHGIDGAALFDRLQAGETLGAALGLPAGTGDLLYARGHRWLVLGLPARAEPLFRALCLIEPGRAAAWLGLGLCLRLGGTGAGALSCFETAIALDEAWPVPHLYRAEALLLRKAPAEARLAYAACMARAGAGLPTELGPMVQRLSAMLADEA